MPTLATRPGGCPEIWPLSWIFLLREKLRRRWKGGLWHQLSLSNLLTVFSPHPAPQGMAALNGGLGSSGLSNGTGSTMEALTQAYSGIQQYAAAALPTLYNQNLLTQQSIGAAGSQKEGECQGKLQPGAGRLLHLHQHRKAGQRPGEPFRWSGQHFFLSVSRVDWETVFSVFGMFSGCDSNQNLCTLSWVGAAVFR